MRDPCSSVEVPDPLRFPEIFRSRDFRLLWGGQFVSLLAEQFFLVALPWLVLQLTGDAFAVGTVVAVTAAPRAVFLLLGGAEPVEHGVPALTIPGAVGPSPHPPLSPLQDLPWGTSVHSVTRLGHPFLGLLGYSPRRIKYGTGLIAG